MTDKETMEVFYLGDDVTLKFDVLVEGKAVKPLSAKASIYDPGDNFIGYGDVTISGNEVACKISRNDIVKTGEYVVVFAVFIRNIGKTDNVVHFKVRRLPVSQKVQRQLAKVGG